MYKLNKTCIEFQSEIKEDLNQWGDTLCSWIGRLNGVRISFFPKLIHRFNAIFMKSQQDTL